MTCTSWTPQRRSVSWSCWYCGHRQGCGSCSLPVTTCGWGCTWQGTTHGVLISQILNLPTGPEAPEGPADGQVPTTGKRVGTASPRLTEPLSQAEVRVLRYLPTNLTLQEIAGQLYLSVNTIRTHTRHIYEKLGAHRRHQAVELARDCGLLAPSARRHG